VSRARAPQPRNALGHFCKADDVDVASSAGDPTDPVVAVIDGTSFEPDEAKASRAASSSLVPPSDPAQLVMRVTRAIENELSQIEDIMNGARVSPAKRSEAEKRARLLASLARTLAEVTKLREGTREARADHEDDAVPRDLDEFRRTLERRLAQMAEGAAGETDRRDEPGGDGVA
jgi:hypothetical protein